MSALDIARGNPAYQENFSREFERMVARRDAEEHFKAVSTADAFGAASGSNNELVRGSEYREQVTPAAWLMYLTLHRQSVWQMVGAPYRGKTTVAVHLSCSIATGRTCFGREIDRPGKVLYLAIEDPVGVAMMVEAWEQRYECDEPVDVFIPADTDFDLTSEVDRLRLETLIAELGEDCALVVIDTQAAATPGLQEKDNTEMAEFLGRLDRLAQSMDTSVMLIHHTGHTEQNRARGASSQGGGAYTVMVVGAENALGHRSLHTEKVKRTQKWERPEYFVIEGETIGMDDKDRQVSAGVVREVSADVDALMGAGHARHRAQNQTDDELVVAALQLHGELNTTRLREVCHDMGLTNTGHLGDAVARLVDAGTVVKRRDGVNQMHSLEAAL